MSMGDLFLNRMKTAKKVTGYQLAYIIFETMRILTKYCIIREIHINILKIHIHSEREYDLMEEEKRYVFT